MITATFYTNFILGFVLAAEFGQVSLEIFRRGLQHGLKQSLLTSLGGTFADFIYLNIAITGIILILNHSYIIKLLWVIGGLSILYIGVSGLKNSFKEKELVSKYTNTKSFVAGFLLNFAHPLNLIWWITLLSPIIIDNIQKTSITTAYLNGLGICFGVLSWWIILSTFTMFAKKFFTIKILQYISAVSSTTLICFSVWFFYQSFII